MSQPPRNSGQDFKIQYVPHKLALPSSSPTLNTISTKLSPLPTQENTIIFSLEMIVTKFGPKSQWFTCQFCYLTGKTKVVTEPSKKTNLLALCLCCFLCWPCVCMPYCYRCFSVKNHYCVNCGKLVGSYQA